MSPLKHVLSPLWALAIVLMCVACAPEYTRQRGEEFAGDARLLDSIDIERSNERLLSRQAQVCLVSAHGGEEAGSNVLRAIQAVFSGYFLTVGVAGDSIDYLRAVASPPCPDASYLFYVQPSSDVACDGGDTCVMPSHFVFTVINLGDQSLVDRITFSIRKSFLPTTVSEQERRQKAFEQLAIALTGAKNK